MGLSKYLCCGTKAPGNAGMRR